MICVRGLVTVIAAHLHCKSEKDKNKHEKDENELEKDENELEKAEKKKTEKNESSYS